MPSATKSLKKFSAIITVCSVGLAVQAQLIDPLDGTGGISYATYLVNDVSHGGGLGVSLSQSGSGLQANYLGTGTSAEQSLFLATVGSFSTVFSVGQRLSVNVAQPVSATAMDFGLAISDASPIAATASSGSGWDSRGSFDWASISLRPSQNAIRANSSISGAVVTGNGVLGVGTPTSVSQLYIDWVSADVFTLGYIDSSSVGHVSETITFNSGSTIGAQIGFYGDLRATGTSLGNFTDLTISPIPEPSTMAICGLGFAGLLAFKRLKK